MRFLLFISMWFMAVTLYSQTPPLLVNSFDTTITSITETIGKQLPEGTEILLFHPNVMNTDPQEIETIVKKTGKLFNSKAKKRGFTITSEDTIVKNHPDIATTLNNYPSENDLITIGKLLNFDAVLLVNISKTRHETRMVWSNASKSLVRKEIYLLQCNLFDPDKHTVFLRFYNYFYSDQF